MADKNVEAFLSPKFRVAFAWAISAKPPRADAQNKKPRFTVLALFPKGTDLTQMKAGAKAAAVNKWDSKADTTVGLATFKGPFKPALSIVNNDGEPYFPWADGFTAVELWSYTAPGIVGPKNDPATGKLELITTEADFYSGCWARAKVRPYAYDGRKEQKGFGINFDLVNLQKLGDDEPLGGAARSKAEDDFQPIESSGTDDFM